jgi:hypothetical protein
MGNRTRLAVLAAVVLVVGVPLAYSALLGDADHLSWVQCYLLVCVPPVVSAVLAASALRPSRSRPHRNRDDWLGIAVGSASIWILLAGVGLVGLGSLT